MDVGIWVCKSTDITACDLAAEIMAAGDGVMIETYLLLPGDGLTAAGQMLWLQDAGRAGIAWGADAIWTDAVSPDDALRRYFAGEMDC